MADTSLNINPFDGDFGDPNFSELETVFTSIPKCHLCNKRLLSGKIIKRVDIQMDWDFEKVVAVEIFYWHEQCWKRLAPKE